MMFEYHEIDEKGFRTGDVRIFDEKDKIPNNFKKTWGDQVFFNPVYDLINDKWIEGRNLDEVLQLEKYKKIEELNEKSSIAIMQGFTSTTTGHFYEFEIHDQSNFTQQMLLILSDPTITTITWKTLDAGIVNHTVDEFKAIIKESEQHKRQAIGKLWQLKDKVMALTTIEEVRAIEW